MILTLLINLLPSVPGISAVPHDDNLRYFDVEIHGPSQSPYEGMLRPVKAPLTAGCEKLTLTFTVQAASSSSSYFSPTTTP